ncbi:MAG: peptidase M16 [Cyanobacteria bacterium QH_8_48_120]|nr:MAG: peptidase M16 [Cyanobacteria bacterium QH_10_48_56]PSO63449.1 MAG: peptidase M16 [Cyanobacteria bacterium QH_7_48_89]PSO65739.1 MAG: peptidase M16 [Cyanobacteria bacterium QH_6_48_35]PSO73273.1 MAG: peptidase M16 [Cyanobacteria bacterium QH_8_48_120]PSO76406.1 MAG: peptidase M16 [Cyanobacteria bacterium QH_3_48_40]PSO81631.1 MAG: peptidase M16 [Cyanobacteria bacterium QH_9_48_43]PSO95622.1 MAG: peptidase M16 [Cyanobacteria bacterium SW_6_48_11]PSP03842.1 MAG: peptidase M16 [Cyanobact
MPQLSGSIDDSKFPANIFRWDSGLTVIHQHIPATPVVVADVWVHAGTSAEPDEWAGMAHFLEHMIFKGTKHLAPGAFDEVIENCGGMTNAATSYDYAHFFLTTAAPYLGETLPCLADILLHPTIPDEEFAREREVVLEEIRASNDEPEWLGFQTLCQSLYQRHPYGRSILGTEAQLKERSPNQMRCFHGTHYQPENISIALVGGIEQESALSLVDRSFEQFSVRSECPPTTAEAEPPLTGIRRNELRLPQIEQARLLMAWMGPSVEQLQDAFGLEVLSVVLSEGRSSRLVRELREEKQLVQDIASGFSLQRDSSLFTITALLAPEEVEEVEKIICDRLSLLQAKPVSEAELNRAQRLLCNDFAFSTETPGQLAGLYGYYNTIATAELSVAYPHRIQQLQPSDLQRTANQYLSPERYAVTVMKGE